MKVIASGLVAACATSFTVVSWGTPQAYLLAMVAFVAAVVLLGEIGRLTNGRQ